VISILKVRSIVVPGNQAYGAGGIDTPNIHRHGPLGLGIGSRINPISNEGDHDHKKKNAKEYRRETRNKI
jgi:hypothetical protein